MSADAQPTIVLTLSCPPSANRIWRKVPGFKHPLLSEEYRAWILDAGWQARMQLVNIPTILGAFNARVTVPAKSRRDLDNWPKPLFDLCQRVGAIRNDRGLKSYTVVADSRDDCMIALWDLGGPPLAEAKKARPRPGGDSSPRAVGTKPRTRPSAAAVKRGHRWNAARGLGG